MPILSTMGSSCALLKSRSASVDRYYRPEYRAATTSRRKETRRGALAKLPAAERESLIERAAAGEVVTAKPPTQPAAAAVAGVGAVEASTQSSTSVVQPAGPTGDELSEFLSRADAAAKAARYDGELLYDEPLAAARTVVRTWQKFLVELGGRVRRARRAGRLKCSKLDDGPAPEQ